MTPSRKKLITSSVLLLGVGDVVVAGITLYPSLRERYWIWRLEADTEEERQEAAERLGELGSVKAIPSLIDTVELALVQYEKFWKVDRSTSRLYFRTVRMVKPGRGVVIVGIKMPSGPGAYVNAIRSILKSRPERAEKRLKLYLSDEREFVRAVAASILFAGTSRAREYVSEQRLAGDVLDLRKPPNLLAPVESY